MPFFASGFPFIFLGHSVSPVLLALMNAWSVSTYNVECIAFKFAGHSVHALLTYICLLVLAQGHKAALFRAMSHHSRMIFK